MKRYDVEIFGRPWNLEITLFPVDNEMSRGECDLSTKTMRVYKHLSDEVFLETVIHEALHSLDWFKDEEWVDQSGKDLSKILLQLFEIRRKS